MITKEEFDLLAKNFNEKYDVKIKNVDFLWLREQYPELDVGQDMESLVTDKIDIGEKLFKKCIYEKGTKNRLDDIRANEVFLEILGDECVVIWGRILMRAISFFQAGPMGVEYTENLQKNIEKNMKEGNLEGIKKMQEELNDLNVKKN